MSHRNFWNSHLSKSKKTKSYICKPLLFLHLMKAYMYLIRKSIVIETYAFYNIELQPKCNY